MESKYSKIIRNESNLLTLQPLGKKFIAKTAETEDLSFFLKKQTVSDHFNF